MAKNIISKKWVLVDELLYPSTNGWIDYNKPYISVKRRLDLSTIETCSENYRILPVAGTEATYLEYSPETTRAVTYSNDLVLIDMPFHEFDAIFTRYLEASGASAVFRG